MFAFLSFCQTPRPPLFDAAAKGGSTRYVEMSCHGRPPRVPAPTMAGVKPHDTPRFPRHFTSSDQSCNRAYLRLGGAGALQG